jgi:hypothetical protein
MNEVFARAEELRMVPVASRRNRREGVEDLLSPKNNVSGTDITVDEFLRGDRAKAVWGVEELRLPRVSRLTEDEKNVGLELRKHMNVSDDPRTSVVCFDHVRPEAVFYHEGSPDLKDRYVYCAAVLSHEIDFVLHPLRVQVGKVFMIPPATAYSAIGGMDVYRVLEEGVEVELPERDEKTPDIMYAQRRGVTELDDPNLLPVIKNPIQLSTVEVEMLHLSRPYERKKVRTGDLAGALWVTSGEVALGIRGQKPMTTLPGNLSLLFPGTEYLVNPILPSRAVFLKAIK